ncbi:MAG: InlB B-repeat-containing protein [Paludibacteraceae bacterium]|nr:InlB B-repeat-containing protein [Paludibacteraceae bacterium]
MRKIFNLKSNLFSGAKTLLLSSLLLCGVGNAWADRTAKAYALPNTSDSKGKSLAEGLTPGGVYVSVNNGKPTSEYDYYAYDVSSKSGLSAYGYYVALSAKGYEFKGWYSDAGATSLKTYDASFTSDNIKANSEIRYYAKFSPITYSITYNGVPSGVSNPNPSTYNIESDTITFSSLIRTGYTFSGWNPVSIPKGSTGDKSTTASWTANKYNVTYDAQEGFIDGKGEKTIQETYDGYYTCPTPTRDGYDFQGWFTATSGGGTRITTESQVKITTGQTLYAYWQVVNVIIHPAEAQSVSFTARTETKTATLTFPVENATSISNFSGVTSSNPEWEVTGASYSNNLVSVTLSFTATENTTTRGNHESTITLTGKNGASSTGTITASVHMTPSFTDNVPTSKLVDDAAIDLNTLWTSTSDGTKEYEVKTWTAASGSHSGTPVKPAISGTTLSLGDAGTVVLELKQSAGTSSEEKTATHTLTINRRDNTITASYAGSMYMDATQNVTISSNNTNTPIVATQTVGNTIATLNAAQTQVTSYAYLGTATWTLSQAETYKYKAASDVTMSIVVQQATEQVCYVVDAPAQKSKTTGTFDFDGVEIASYPITVEGKHVWFEAYTSGTKGHYYIQYSTNNGSSYSDLANPDVSGSYKPFDYDLPAGTTNIRFYAKTGATLTHYVQNVKVSRKTYLNSTSSITIDKKPTGEPIYVDDEEPVTATLHVDWSFCNGGTLKLSSTNPKFTLSQSSITEATDGTNGSKDITVSYHSTTADTDEGKIVIYNDVYRVETAITGITIKHTPTMDWWTEEDPYTLTLAEGTINHVLDVTDGCAVTLSVSSGDEQYLSIDNVNGTITGIKSMPTGSYLTLTGTVDDDRYYGTTTKYIYVTDLLKQTITWEQSLQGLAVGDPNKELTATAHNAITYQSSDESVVKVVNGSYLQIVGKGNCYVIATAAEGNGYAQAQMQKKVVVRNPDEACAPTESFGTYKFSSSSPATILIPFHSDYVQIEIIRGDAANYRTATISEYYLDAQGNVQSHELESFTPPASASGYNKAYTIKPESYAIYCTTDANNDMKIRSGQFTMAKTLALTPTSLSLTTTTTSAESKTFTIDYTNIQGPLEYTSDNPYLSFSPATGTVGDCGDLGSATITVTYAPAEVQDGDYTITVWDGKTETLKKTITVHCKATAPVQTMTWDQTFGTKLTTDLITFDATTDAVRTEENPYPVVYSTSDASVATVINGNQLNILKSGTVTVTASQDGIDGKGRQRYNAVSKYKVITIDKATPTVTFPTAPAAITYGTALAQSQLVGGSAKVVYQGSERAVTGSFNWADAGRVKPAGTQSYQVVWTPDNADLYNSVNDNVSITINKATPTITWTASTGPYKATEDINVLTATSSNTEAGTVNYTIIEQIPAGIADIKDGKLVTYNPGSVTVRATVPASDNFKEQTMDKTFTFIQLTPTFTANYDQTTADGLKVDGTITDAYTFTNTDANMTFRIESHLSSSVNNGTEVIAYDKDTKTVTALNAGTATLTFTQPESSLVPLTTKSFTFTVTKIDNPITVTLGSTVYDNNEVTIYLGDGIMVSPSSQHKNTPFEGTQLDGGTYGTYYPDQNAFYAAATTGSVHCQITQAETYKYAAGQVDFTVHVAEFVGSCNALELTEGSVKNNSVSWNLTGAGDQLYWSLSGDKVVIEVSNTGNDDDWHKIVPENHNVNPVSMDANPNAKNAKYIRVRSWATLSRDYSLYVTRKQFIAPSVTDLYPKKILKGGTTTATFDIDYSACENTGYYTYDDTYHLAQRIRLQSNNTTGKITMSPDNVPGTDAASGKKTITVTYHSDEVGTDEATLAIYNRAEKQRVYVYCETIDKWTPTIAWQYGGDAKNIGMTDVAPEVKAYNDNNDELKNVTYTFSSSDPTVATIVNGQIHPLKRGTVIITATIQANDTLVTASSTQTFYVSDGTSVTLDANGGTPDNTIHVAYMATQLDQAPAMSRTGYTLNGFYTATTGGTKVVNNNGTLVANTTYTDANGKWTYLNQAATLYAQWTANTYTVTLNPNYEGGATKMVTATYGSAMPNTAALQRTGHAFQGYFDQQVDGTQYYSSTGTSTHVYDVAGPTTLYAHWIGADFFTWNGGNALTFKALTTIPNNVATAFSGLAVNYESANPAIVEVLADGSLYAHQSGTVNITATTVGDGYFASISETKTFTITKASQSIVWNQSFAGYEADPITGQFSIDVPLTAYTIDAAGNQNNQPVTYTTTGTIASVTGDAVSGYVLHINGTGSATIKAIVAQGTVYSAIEETKNIYVRAAGEPCNTTVTHAQFTLYSRNPSVSFDLNSVPYSDVEFTMSGMGVSGVVYINGTDIHGKTKEYGVIHENGAAHVDLHNDTLQSLTFSTSAELIISGVYTISNVQVHQSSYMRANVEYGKIDEEFHINDNYRRPFTVDYSDKPIIRAIVTNHGGLKIERQEPTDNACGDYGTFTFVLASKEKWMEPTEFKDTIHIVTSVGDDISIPVHLKITTGGSYTFVGSEDRDWNNVNNWRIGAGEEKPQTPPTMINEVVINDTVYISNPVEVYSMRINNDTYWEQYGYVIIGPQGGLTIYNGSVAPQDLDQSLFIESSLEHTGYFRVLPKAIEKWPNQPRFTMQYASKGSLDSGANKDATWQYFGIPVNGADFTVDYVTWLYEWNEPQGWLNLKSASQPVHLKPFQGYAITQYGKPVYNFTGPLNMGKADLHLTYTEGDGMWGDNMFANSYTSPIDVKLFTEEDFENLDYMTFYLYNSGSWNDWNNATQGGDWDHLTDNAGAPGTFTAIPALAATYLETEQTLIAPMQGICIHTDQPSGATVHFDYAKHVWDAMPMGSKDDMNAPLLIPARKASVNKPEGVSDEIWEAVQYAQFRRDSIAEAHRQKVEELRHRARLTVYGENSGVDHIYLLEKDGFTADYDNGYDAYKMFNDGLLNLYTSEEFGEMAVVATDNLEGTHIGFDAGEGNTYQLKVTSVIGEDLYLKDLTNGVETPLQEDQTYMFNANAGSENMQRFVIVRHTNPGPTTGGDETIEDNAYIWTDREYLHVEHAAANTLVRLYSSDGKLLTSTTVSGKGEINISMLPNSVYMVMLNEKTTKFVKQ